MATTISTILGYNPGSICIGATFLFSSELSLIFTNLNFPSLTIWYKESYDISEISFSHFSFKFICSGRKFIKDQTLLFGKNLKEALETKPVIVKEAMTTDR